MNPMWEGLNPPYGTIVADPPWHYDKRVVEWGDSRPMPYSTMSVEEIACLPVSDLASPGCHVFLWTTNRYLKSAFAVLEQWRCSYISTLTWCKPLMGHPPGPAFASTTEFCLYGRVKVGEKLRSARIAAGLSQSDVVVAVRGRKTGLVERWEADACFPSTDDWRGLAAILDLPMEVCGPLNRAPSSWYQWPRGAHSEKPAAFQDLVEQVSPGPYVELFARQPRLGWDSWGHGYEQAVTR